MSLNDTPYSSSRMPRIHSSAVACQFLSPTVLPARSLGSRMPLWALMKTKPWRNRRWRNTGMAVRSSASPLSLASRYDEHDCSATSNSRKRDTRQWRVDESMSVSTVSSMPSGWTVPSLRARMLS